MKIERMNKGNWGKVRAFFDVQTDEGFTIKGFKLISDAAKNAGALATYLSGSGPTISAITNNKEVTINYEMLEAASRLNIDGKGFINNVSYKGAHIIE